MKQLSIAGIFPEGSRARAWQLQCAPYTYQALLLVVIPVAFLIDRWTTSIAQQNVLGAGAWVLLVLCTRFSPPTERRQVWIMVAVATCIEVWGSIIWGIYRYRFGNLPMFVPPGHGLVYLFALRSARTPMVLRYPTQTKNLALACATAWMLFGLTVEPLFMGRLDLTGALFWPVFVVFMRRPSAPIYATAFFVTSILELWGTNMGTWAWQVYAPVSHIPTGNPPSVIAAGYCIMDFWSLQIAAMLPATGMLARMVPRLRARMAQLTG